MIKTRPDHKSASQDRAASHVIKVPCVLVMIQHTSIILITHRSFRIPCLICCFVHCLPSPNHSSSPRPPPPAYHTREHACGTVQAFVPTHGTVVRQPATVWSQQSMPGSLTDVDLANRWCCCTRRILPCSHPCIVDSFFPVTSVTLICMHVLWLCPFCSLRRCSWDHGCVEPPARKQGATLSFLRICARSGWLAGWCVRCAWVVAVGGEVASAIELIGHLLVPVIPIAHHDPSPRYRLHRRSPVSMHLSSARPLPVLTQPLSFPLLDPVDSSLLRVHNLRPTYHEPHIPQRMTRTSSGLLPYSGVFCVPTTLSHMANLPSLPAPPRAVLHSPPPFDLPPIRPLHLQLLCQVAVQALPHQLAELGHQARHLAPARH